jgi:predicted membrane protein
MKRKEFRIIGYLFFMMSFYFLGLTAYHISVLFTEGWNESAFNGAIISFFASLASIRLSLFMFRQAQS